jgi:hypothetical protein
MYRFDRPAVDLDMCPPNEKVIEIHQPQAWPLDPFNGKAAAAAGAARLLGVVPPGGLGRRVSYSTLTSSGSGTSWGGLPAPCSSHEL